MQERIQTQETRLVSGLLTAINETCGFFKAMRLTRAVQKIFQIKPIDNEYTQNRCALLCEQLADAKQALGQRIITKDNFIVDIEAAVDAYNTAKNTVDLEIASMGCQMGLGNSLK